jgi:Zn-dependent M28 family amino/carboxypeptidase
MHRRPLAAVALFALAACVAAPAIVVPTPTPVAAVTAPTPHTEAEVDAHIAFLSSDLLEGRGTSTRGGRIAAQYIASQLRLAGAEPGVSGSWFQPFPISVVTADPATIRVQATGRASGTLRYPADVVVWAGSVTPASEARGELVFVGYGATAPEYRWDDFKDVDVRGKVLLVLVNDPPAPTNEPQLFGGRAMTYYGRWTYKFEEAERRGAAGMLIVHTTERAGYGWQTVVNSWTGAQHMLARPASAPPPIGIRGWITDSAATTLLAQAGLQLSDLRRRAESRDFRPVPTGISMELSLRSATRTETAQNVIGVIRGSDPARANEYVTYTAHYDHLGIGNPVNADSIYNGTWDNATGTAVVLAVARAFGAAPRPARSLMFVLVDAEESGLLGSQFFAENPPVPIGSIIANVNVDNPYGVTRFRDLAPIGATKSSLGPTLEEFVRPMGVRLSPEEAPEQGFFYRSDHFSFARVGVPGIMLRTGTDYVDRPAGWGATQHSEYRAQRYHQPSDEYVPGADMSGLAQLVGIAHGFGSLLANSAVVPTWNPDSEFHVLRPAR